MTYYLTSVPDKTFKNVFEEIDEIKLAQCQ